jgi:hypothetical protein
MADQIPILDARSSVMPGPVAEQATLSTPTA